MPLIKTEKALAELRSRERTLGLKARALLLLADGQKSAGELQTLVQAAPTLVQQLLAEGYLARHTLEPAQAKTPQVPQVSADPFHGRRSLATARLYLLDLTERLFARQDPAFAQHLRDRLRTAPDQDAVVAAAQELLARVQAVAGAERAEGIQERLERLWPHPTAEV